MINIKKKKKHLKAASESGMDLFHITTKKKQTSLVEKRSQKVIRIAAFLQTS